MDVGVKKLKAKALCKLLHPELSNSTASAGSVPLLPSAVPSDRAFLEPDTDCIGTMPNAEGLSDGDDDGDYDPATLVGATPPATGAAGADSRQTRAAYRGKRGRRKKRMPPLSPLSPHTSHSYQLRRCFSAARFIYLRLQPPLAVLLQHQPRHHQQGAQKQQRGMVLVVLRPPAQPIHRQSLAQ